MKKILFALLAMVVSSAWSQIYEPEGLNMPGTWNGWTNIPTNLAFANPNQAIGGRLVKINQSQPMWQTIFSAAASGGDVAGGSYDFKFSSGPVNSPWNNTWGEAAFTMNTLHNVNFNAGPNNSVTLLNGKWYTMNWMDAGYASTQAIFMETSSEPVVLSGVLQAPANGSVESTDGVTVTVTASAQPSVEELVYVRYSTDAFVTSSLAAVTFTGTVGTATLPAQLAATTVQYYVFSTTIANPVAADVRKVTIRSLTSSGAYYHYTVNSSLPPVNITFQVDMQQVTLDPSGVFIAGSFNGFSNQAMASIGGGVYTYTTSLAQGANVQYKFKNGTSGWEGLTTAPCGDGINRTYAVGSEDATVDLVCFNSCAACPSSFDVTFRVNMSAESVGGNVYINGNFPPANWSVPQLMLDAGGGVYIYTANLGAGNEYEYKFINGSSYEGNLSAPCGNGSNRTLTVPSANTVLPVSCFGYCGDCTMNAVTFRVDMSQQTIDSEGVFIAGSFNGFSNSAMTDVGGGIYTYTVSLQQGESYEYKFKNGTNGWEDNIASPCGNGSNRVVNVSNANSQLLAITCFNSCGACPMFQDITFAVNMANVLVSVNGVHLAGAFGDYGYANWSPSEIPMTDPDGNGIYAVVLTLPVGQSFEYKFINGNDWPWAEGIPSECSLFSNRVYTVPTYDAVAGGAPVCFGSCTACAAGVSNDSPYSATNVQFSTNNTYPNCYAIIGSTVNAENSPQSPDFLGHDVWYRFTAQSIGVSITMSSATQDDAIALFTKSGNTFSMVAGSLENTTSGSGDFERLNFSGLIPGLVYYVSVGSAVAAPGGAFSLCIQHLMPSTCGTAVPVVGLNLCDTYKATYRGAPSQGVTYTFNLTPTGVTAGSPTVLSGTNGLIALSNPTLALRYGGTYMASVDVRYNLLNGAGTAEPISVLGATGGNCSNVVMRTQPNLEVRIAQRCNASLFRSSWLAGNSVGGAPRACGVQNYTYEFTEVVSCADGTEVSALPSLYNTAGTTPYLQLGVLPNLGNTGAWNVRIRPNFSYGDGTFGPVQRIQVAGTAASGELEYELVDMEKEMDAEPVASLYPNPNNGDFVNVNLSNLEKGTLQVRVLDAAGRAVTTRTFAVEGSLSTTLTFDEQLSAGVYMIETLNAGRVQTQRLVVQ